jgi:DNA/RNA-binding domain of Phe-tRNA-synthetase-like protein
MMKDLYYSVDQSIFEKFPGFVRGVVLSYDVTNGPSPEELVTLMRKEEEGLRQRLKLETLTEEPRIQSWREAFRSLGIKPSEFRSSIEAMARRALRGDALPSINMLVDIGNIISLRYLVPAGGHSMDELTQDIALRPASGQEDFTAFGTEVLEHPEPGEIVFVEGNIVLTRRWVWRQSNHTLTLPETRSIEFNIDGLPPVTPEEVEKISQDVMEMITKYCGGRSRIEMLSAKQMRIGLKE